MAMQTIENTPDRSGQAQASQDAGIIDQMQAKLEESVKPEDQEAFKRVTAAGMKVMFSEQSHQMMLEELQKPGDMDEKLAQGIAGLMLMLYKQSKGTMPPQIIMQAAAWLLLEAARFVQEAGIGQVDNQTIRNAMDGMVGILMKKFGASEDQIMQNFGGQAGQSQPTQQAQPAKPAPTTSLLNGG